MTIASTNIGFSTIAAEKGIGNSNLSLATLAGGQMKLPLANDSSSTSSEYGTFDQVWYYGSSYRSGSTVTSAQGQGVNGLNAAPHSMSEWVGFDPNTDGYSIAGSGIYPAVYTFRTETDDSCFIRSGCANDIYCQKVSDSIRIYVTEVSGITWSGAAYGKNHSNTSTALSGTTEIGRITAGTGQALPTTCTMDYDTTTNTATGGYLGGGTIGTVDTGATSTTNLGSTKIGYRVQCGGWSEAGPGTSGMALFENGIQFEFGGISGVTGTATVQVQLNQEALATHQSGGWEQC